MSCYILPWLTYMKLATSYLFIYVIIYTNVILLTMATFNLPNFHKFDVDELTTISTRWNKYKQRSRSGLKNHASDQTTSREEALGTGVASDCIVLMQSCVLIKMRLYSTTSFQGFFSPRRLKIAKQ